MHKAKGKGKGRPPLTRKQIEDILLTYKHWWHLGFTPKVILKKMNTSHRRLTNLRNKLKQMEEETGEVNPFL